MAGSKKNDQLVREVIIENLKSLAVTISEMFGRNCEVVVHDLTNLDKSLIFTAGDVTMRTPGAPITDLIVKELRKKGNNSENIVSYKSITKDGRVLKSSTAFFRDKDGIIFACLCINFDITSFMNVNALIQEFTQINTGFGNDDKQETFASNVHETIDSLVANAIEIIGIQPKMMQTDDKINFVKILEEKGVFLIKGAVDYVAIILGVSKFSVYNYLNKVRANNALLK